MFGGFGSRFAKFGTGGGGRSIASPADLLQLFKRGSEDGAMIDELDNTTDLELANVNALSFDEVDDYVDTNTPNTSKGSYEVTFVPTIVNDTMIIAGSRPSTNRRTYIAVDNQSVAVKLSAGIGNHSNNTFRGATTLTLGTRYRAKLTWDDATNNAELFLDQFDGNGFVLEATTSYGSTASDADIFVGALNNYGSNFLPFNGEIHNFIFKDGSGVNEVHYPFAEGSGTTVYDVSGNGNHGTITGATWSTADGIESWNHEYGFDTDIFKGYAGHWSSVEDSDGTWIVNESNLTLTGNAGISGKTKQVVDGMAPGDTLVVSGTITQTTGQANSSDVFISSSSVGWSEGSVSLGGQIGTYNFSTTLNANSSTCDIRFIALNGANLVISDLKFTVVKKIPALNTKTKQVATFDGVADRVDFTAHTTAVGDVLDFEFDLVSNEDDANGDHRCLLSDKATKYIALLDNDDGRIVVRGSSIRNATGAIKVADGMSTLKVTIDSASQVSVSINGGAAETLSTDFTGIALARLMGAGGNNVRYLNASVKSFSITNSSGDKAVEYDFQNDIGTTNIVDISGNGNDGELIYGAGALESFWGTRVADASGSLVSADYATGNTSISNPPALDNDSEVDLVQTDSVFTSGTVSLWSADGSAQDEKTFAQLIDHATNRNGYHRVWVKVVNGRVVTIAQYNLDKDFLPSDVLKNERYFGGTSGALRDVNGDFILDSSGFVLFAG